MKMGYFGHKKAPLGDGTNRRGAIYMKVEGH